MAGTPAISGVGEGETGGGGAVGVRGAGWVREAGGGGWAGKFQTIMRMYERGVMATLTTAQQAVLVYLLTRCDGRGFAWPAVATIAGATGLSRRHVIRAIDQLVARQLVRRGRDGGGRKSTTYVVRGLTDAKRGETPRRGDAAGPSRTAGPSNTCPSDSASHTCPSGPRAGLTAIRAVTSCHPSRDTGVTRSEVIDPEREFGGAGRDGARASPCGLGPNHAAAAAAPAWKPPDPPGQGLFDDHAAVERLVQRGFAPGDAMKLGRCHGAALCLRAMAEADAIRKRDGARLRSYRGLLVRILGDGGGWVPEHEATVGRIYPQPQAPAEAAVEAPPARVGYAEMTAEQREMCRRLVLAGMPAALRRVHERRGTGGTGGDGPSMRALIEREANERGVLFLEIA